MSPRRLAAGVAAAVIVTGLGTGCGHGGPSGIGAGPDDSSARPPSQANTKSRAEALAKTVILRASDFPYLENQSPPEKPSAGDRKSEREFEHCIGGTALGSQLAEAASPSFNGTVGAELQEFSSGASAFASAAGAARVGAVLRSHRVFSCLSRLLEPALEAQEAGTEIELMSVKTSRLPTPAPSVPGSFGFRIRATVAYTRESRQLTAFSAPAQAPTVPTITVFIDIVTFVSGSLEVDLTATGAPQPVSRALEKQLVLLLQGRAEAAQAQRR